MYHFLLLAIFNSLTLFSAYGQASEQKTFCRAILISSENDNYLWSSGDRYFTNGLHLSYSYLSPASYTTSELHRPLKTIISFAIGQEIYTPDNIKYSEIRFFDRPYASYLYGQAGVSRFPSQNSNISFEMNIGWIGPRAAGKQVQTWWHKVIHFTPPKGWDFQIKNEAVINFRAIYQRDWRLFPYLALASSSKLEAGTAFNSLSQTFQLRAGKINSMNHSVLFNSQFTATHQPRAHEYFAFYSFGGNRVLHNTLIQGSLFYAARSLHTEEVVPYLWIQQAGLVYSKSAVSIKLILHKLSQEVVGGKNHRYLRIDLAYNF